MKKYSFVLPLLFVLGACKPEKPAYALLSGTISNGSAKEVTIIGPDFKKVIPLTEQGAFSDTLYLPEAGYYELRAGEYTNFYLENGYNLSLAIDAQQFDESITYTGKGSEINNYLAQKFLLDEQLAGSELDFYKLSPEEFQQKNNDIQAQLQQLLEKAKLDKAFTVLEQKNIWYTYLLRLRNYKPYHEYYTLTENTMLPAGFLTPLEALTDYDNAGDYKNFKSYQRLIQLRFNEAMEEAKEKGGNRQEVALQYITALKSQPVKEGLLKVLFYEISPQNEKLGELYDGMMSLTANASFKADLTEKYEKVKRIAKGSPSPAFDYENHKGGKTTLADLRGKYVYIDVWATWCAPCKAEIPHLKELENTYHKQNIAFVSISIDLPAAYELWRKMVADEGLGGVQLIADNNWNSKFVTDYAIDGIPRFILIDPDGNIVHADAPRPSSPEIKVLLNEVLKG